MIPIKQAVLHCAIAADFRVGENSLFTERQRLKLKGWIDMQTKLAKSTVIAIQQNDATR
jgi:hypothetical protein